jgi:hypothetical protein
MGHYVVEEAVTVEAPCRTNCRLVLWVAESQAIKLQKVVAEFVESRGGDTMKVTLCEGFRGSTMAR